MRVPCLPGRDHEFSEHGSTVCLVCWVVVPPEQRLRPPGSRPGRRATRPKGSRLARLKELYGPSCVYCGAEATTREHLVPVSRGGSSGIENERPACEPCNGAKANRTPFEWLGERCPPELAGIVAPDEIR